MKIETLADLLDAFSNKEIDENAFLMIDHENGIIYIEHPDFDEAIKNKDEEDEDGGYLFYLSLSQFVKEASQILGIPIDF